VEPAKAKNLSFTVSVCSKMPTISRLWTLLNHLEGNSMKKPAIMVLALVVATLFATRALSQDSKKAEAKPAPGASEGLLTQWNNIGRKLIAMAEDFPSDKYDFKAAPATRSFADRLIHAAAANYYFTNLANGQKPPTEEEPPRSQFKDKAALIAYVKKSFADGAAAIKAKGDKGLSDSVIDPFAEDNPQNAGKDQIRLVDLAYSLVEHSGEVYGQLTVYYRAAGIVPPESRPTS